MMKMVFCICQSPSFLYDSLAPKVNKHICTCIWGGGRLLLCSLSKTYVLSEIIEIEAMAHGMSVVARHYFNFKGENHYG